MARPKKPPPPPPPDGEAPPKPRRARTRRADPAPPDPCVPIPPPADDPPPAEPEPEPARVIPPPLSPREGRLASDIQRTDVSWFCPPWIPSGAVSLVVGDPGSGKSTLGAHLVAQAKRPAILPGYEEDVASVLLPRLSRVRCVLDRCLILDGRLWAFPFDREGASDVLLSHYCDLLWIDPIDSYYVEGSENDGQAVRIMLESLARLAREVGCAVVCARHPGKSQGNVCPGSRQWRAVPRVIVQLTVDAGPPERRIARPYKYPYGAPPPARYYQLVGDGELPPRWEWGQQVEQGELDLLKVDDELERYQVDQAEGLIRRLLADREQEARAVYAAAEGERLQPRTVLRAARRLGVHITRRGQGIEHRVLWSLTPLPTPDSHTDTHPETPVE